MRIAIPYENGQVFQHFGHTQKFKIYDTDGEAVTASQIVTRFGGSIRLNSVQVGIALKELGYTCTRTRHGNIWLVVERTTDEMKSILPEADDTDFPPSSGDR